MYVHLEPAAAAAAKWAVPAAVAAVVAAAHRALTARGVRRAIVDSGVYTPGNKGENPTRMARCHEREEINKSTPSLLPWVYLEKRVK